MRTDQLGGRGERILSLGLYIHSTHQQFTVMKPDVNTFRDKNVKFSENNLRFLTLSDMAFCETNVMTGLLPLVTGL